MDSIPSQNLPVLSTISTEQLRKRQVNALQREVRRMKRNDTQENVMKERTDDNADPINGFEKEVSDNERHAAESLLLLSKQSHKTFKDASVQVKSGDIINTRFCMEFTNASLNSQTGIPTVNLLETLSKLVEKDKKIDNRGLLTTKEKIVLTMMRIKLNITFASLSCLWKVCATTCKNIFEETVSDLSKVLKSCIYWASKDEVLKNIPKKFKKFCSVRVVLDCTEIRLAKSKCLKCLIMTYSHYKKGQTIKYMVGISPGGIIMYVSPGYGGRVSDKCIFAQSGILSMLEPHIDGLMVDKGFLIDKECEEAYINLVRPPFMKNQKLTIRQCMQTKAIAEVRVNVERAIQRIKIFKLLSERVPWNLVPLMDDIMIIAIAISNLSGSIFADKRF